MRWRWGKKTVSISMSLAEATALGALLNEWAEHGGSWVDREDCQGWKRSAIARENRRETITYNNLLGAIEAFFDRSEVQRCRQMASNSAGEKGGGIYVASRASLPNRAAMWRELRSQGWPIISTWIDEDGPGQTVSMGELWSRIAHEVTGAVGLVLYAEPEDFPLKGALVEVGMALAAGVRVVVVAPGVDIEPRSCRPMGSWMMHPLVARADSPVEAFRFLGVQMANAACSDCEKGGDS